MKVNTLGSSIIVKNMQNTKPKQSFGSRFGVNSNSSYDNYQSNTLKQKEGVWQKRKKVITNSMAAIGMGILGIVLYSKGRFGKTKNVISSNNFSPSKNDLQISLKTFGSRFSSSKNDLETSLKTFGLSKEAIIGGVKIENLLKMPESVSKNQFLEVAKKIQEKIKSDAMPNELEKAAVIILEQLRKNLQKNVSNIKNFDLNNEIKDVNILNEILKETEMKPVEENAEKTNEKLQPEFRDLLCCVQGCSNVENINELFNFCKNKPNLISENIESVSRILSYAIKNKVFFNKGINDKLQQHVDTFFDGCEHEVGVINSESASHIASLLSDIINNQVYKKEQKDTLQKYIGTFFDGCEYEVGVINNESAGNIASLLSDIINNQVYEAEQYDTPKKYIDTFFDGCEHEVGVINNESAGNIASLLGDIINNEIYEAEQYDIPKKYIDIFFDSCKYEKNIINTQSAGNIASLLSDIIIKEVYEIEQYDTFQKYIDIFLNTCKNKNGVINKSNILQITASLRDIMYNDEFYRRQNKKLHENLNMFFSACENEEGIINNETSENISLFLYEMISSETYGKKEFGDLQRYIDKFFAACKNQKGLMNLDNAGGIALLLGDIINNKIYEKEQYATIQEHVGTFFDASKDENGIINNYSASYIASLLSNVISNKVYGKEQYDTIQKYIDTFFDVSKNEKGIINNGSASNIALLLSNVISNKVYEKEQYDTIQKYIDTFFDVSKNEKGIINTESADNIALLLYYATINNLYGEDKKNTLQKHIDTFFTACDNKKGAINDLGAKNIAMFLSYAMVNNLYGEDKKDTLQKYIRVLLNACNKISVVTSDNVEVIKNFLMVLSENMVKLDKSSDLDFAIFKVKNKVKPLSNSISWEKTEEEFINENGLPRKELKDYNKKELVWYINTFLERINIPEKMLKEINYSEEQLQKIAKSIFKHLTFVDKNLPLDNNSNKSNYKCCYNRANLYWAYAIYSDAEFNNTEHGCWKMHIYAEDEDDYQKISPIILEYLKNNSVKHKTFYLLSSELFKAISPKQGSKGIVIYPKYDAQNKNNINDIKKIAQDLDKLIRDCNLTIKESNIAGDAKMGTTGRLFYRYEYKSINDCNKTYMQDEYKRFYEENRVNTVYYKDENNKTEPYKLEYPYLPQDGQNPEKYDPLYNFDPANMVKNKL